jgi:ElaB/YqjD/DUF883 family membrane-anchored ribosome-binding protein
VSNITDTSNLRADARKDPATLEREIDQTRANMDQTLGALERKFSPGQLLDQAMGFVKENGGEFASNLGQSIRDNPMPALLTAVGIAWMVAASSRPRSAAGYDFNDSYQLDKDIHSTEYDEMALDEDELDQRDQGEGVLSKAGETVKAAGEKVKAAAEGARKKLAGSRQKLTSSRRAVGSGMRRTTDTAQAQAQQVREGFNNLLTEQPLVVGALGIAVGAIIGAVLPETERENRLLGPIRDKTISEVKERGAESYHQVRKSVSRVGEEAKQAISQSVSQASGSKPAREDRSAQLGDGK